MSDHVNDLTKRKKPSRACVFCVCLKWIAYLSCARAAHRSSGSSLGRDADNETADADTSFVLIAMLLLDLLVLLMLAVGAVLTLLSANTTSEANEPTARPQRSAVSSDRRATAAN